MKPAFIATPAGWPHPRLRPRSEREAATLMIDPPDRVIFVFGSNLAGKHIGGAAATAMKFFGATFGDGMGLHGQSYALPTMGQQLEQLPLADVARHVADFLNVAFTHPHYRFYVTAIGTGIAGLTHDQIAPLFAGATSNCLLPPEWAAFTSSTPDRKDS